MAADHYDCLACGMRLSRAQRICPKCDDPLDAQTDGRIIVADIAHQQERVHEALAKLERLLATAAEQRAAGLRVIVGSGLIREAVLAELRGWLFRGDIKDFSQDAGNRGAVRVQLR